ncbi:hypothetical protein Sango_1236200 [Sesamum angolense]|uniref:Uncharacterized protein n=1 Tax=Sesamum angolense TaxID=2727404 RepID=A0AAE2BTW8_9LAMI|nr:hypothetical protein Sango_1236200 [Sesamum angolense]
MISQFMMIQENLIFKPIQGKELSSKEIIFFTLEAYTDDDYAGSIVDRDQLQSIDFLGGNLASWRSKKQNVVASETLPIPIPITLSPFFLTSPPRAPSGRYSARLPRSSAPLQALSCAAPALHPPLQALSRAAPGAARRFRRCPALRRCPAASAPAPAALRLCPPLRPSLPPPDLSPPPMA